MKRSMNCFQALAAVSIGFFLSVLNCQGQLALSEPAGAQKHPYVGEH
jgi:hypothetical protein